MFFGKINETLIAKTANRGKMQAGLINGSVGVFIFTNTRDFFNRTDF